MIWISIGMVPHGMAVGLDHVHTPEGIEMSADPARLEIALLRAARAVRRAFDVRLNELGLNMTQTSLLTFTRDAGSLTQSELASRLHVGKASVGSFIDDLETRGLLNRSPDPRDRRVWRISLTAKALPIVEEFEEIDSKVRKELRAGLTREQRHQLAQLLLRLEQNAKACAEESLTKGNQILDVG
jgi:DNA-binding MarR family transcriptional regulator